jgi:hypothetical protein
MMTGMILDGVLMLLLVAALGYGARLEKKLAALRAGQQAFASAVTDLNAAAARAEAAVASLRASGPETDLLHDRIIKAREVRAQLEGLIARGPVGRVETAREVQPRPAAAPVAAAPDAAAAASVDEERVLRMAALAERIQGMVPRGAAGGKDLAAILGALTANQTGKQSLNQTRRNLDEDLFAA